MNMNIEETILQEWEKAGGEYALAARLVRKDLEKERKSQEPLRRHHAS